MSTGDDPSAHVVLLAHGSPDPRHAQDIEDLVRRVQDGIRAPVHTAYLDHHGPTPGDVATSLPPEVPVVVVPLLLDSGYHDRVDVPAAVAVIAGGRPVAVTRVLGPDPLLEAAVEEVRAGQPRGTHVPRFLAAGVMRDREVSKLRARGERVADRALARTRAMAELVALRAREGSAALQR
jgi:sirohydrochlorin ferrochelatase